MENANVNTGLLNGSETNRSGEVRRDWLPDMDLNHDKQIQSLLCYRYTIGQAGAGQTVTVSGMESSC